MAKSVLVFFVEEIADSTTLNSSILTKRASNPTNPAQSRVASESLPVMKLD
jgi:hypothetical protein